ncbi:MAG: hypothetical protein INR73_02280 [Williamsia sp.]|nr:hypothetical protein [Williamsia sp.]
MQTNFLSPVLLILVVTLVLVSVVAIFYLYITAKSRERLALIEKGMNPNLARSNFWLQVGIIAGGFCGGLIISDLFNSRVGPLMGFVFAGAGLVIYHIYARRSKSI